MATLHVVRVFCAEGGGGGNPLGVFLDGAEVPEERRQAVAKDLGFSETVFVDDAARGEIRIFTPGSELPFVGHPAVGAAWLIGEEREPVAVLRPPAGEVLVSLEESMTFVTAPAAWCPPWELRRLGSAAEVEAWALPEHGEIFIWAWIDEEAGEVRARCFAPDDGIVEDEATGSAAIMLCVELGRPLAITQGVGSRLLARPAGVAKAAVGGTVELEEVRKYAV